MYNVLTPAPEMLTETGDGFVDAFSEAVFLAGYVGLQTTRQETIVLWDLLTCAAGLGEAAHSGSYYDEDAGVYVANPNQVSLLDQCTRIVVSHLAHDLSREYERAYSLKNRKFGAREDLSLEEGIEAVRFVRPGMMRFRVGEGSYTLLREDVAQRLSSFSVLMYSVDLKRFVVERNAREGIGERVEDLRSVATRIPTVAEARAAAQADFDATSSAYGRAMRSLAEKLQELRP